MTGVLRRLPGLAGAVSALLALGLALGIAACTAAREPLQTSRPLPDYLESARKAQVFPIETLYDPPPEEDYDLLYQLADSPVLLDLAQNATAYTAWRKGLAVGFADGQVTVYGRQGCEALKEPLPGPVALLAWGPFSRYLAATDDSRKLVHVIDLETCSVVRTIDPAFGVGALAMSDAGATLAVMDKAGRLSMGAPTGSMHPVEDLPSDFIGMGFTPGEGVLAVVDASGQVSLFNAKNRTRMDTLAVDGGPFAGVRFVDARLALETRFGPRLAYDLVGRKPIPYSRQLDQFSLEDKELRYRTWTNVLHVKPYRGWTGLRVQHSPALGMIRVWDVDGSLRYYSARDGLERGCATATDWTEVETNEKGNFCLGETCYILADVAFQWDHDQLLCRWIEGQGFFLWWRKTVRPDQYSPLPDHLPQRDCILATRPAVWHPVIPPPDFP